MQLWIWRNFRFQLPADWEMLQFSRHSQSGRCAFADRYQFRLELSWRVVKGPPDFERMISDYQSKLQEEGMENLKRRRRGSWQGVEGMTDGLLTTRFSRYFPGELCLVELVFIWPNRRDSEMEQRVLDSVNEESKPINRFQRWKAFGMDLFVSRELTLQNCVVEPAHTEMVFKDSKGHVSERFARRGLVSEWFTGEVSKWLQEWIAKDKQITPMETETSHLNAHSIHRLVAEEHTPSLARLLGKHIRADAAAWICPEDGRLYSVFQSSPAGKMLTNRKLTRPRFSCCTRMELHL